MDYKQQEANFQSNVSYLIGYYEGMLKVAVQELQDETNNMDTMKKLLANLINRTLTNGNDIWENRYEKHYSEVIK